MDGIYSVLHDICMYDICMVDIHLNVMCPSTCHSKKCIEVLCFMQKCMKFSDYTWISPIYIGRRFCHETGGILKKFVLLQYEGPIDIVEIAKCYTGKVNLVEPFIFHNSTDWVLEVPCKAFVEEEGKEPNHAQEQEAPQYPEIGKKY